MRRNPWIAIGCGLVIFAAVSALGGLGDAKGSHDIARALAASGIAGIICGIALFVLQPLEKRVDRTTPRHRTLRIVFYLTFGVWMLLHGPLRIWTGAVGFGDSTLTAAGPSLFAGLALAIASATAYGFKPLTASASGAGFSVLAEVIQLWLPSYTFDVWDVAAGFVGAAIAVPLLTRWPVPVHTEHDAEQSVQSDRREDATPS